MPATSRSSPTVPNGNQRVIEWTTPHDADAAQVRQVIENAGNVCAVIQGHYHPGRAVEVNGIPYIGLAAMVEGLPFHEFAEQLRATGLSIVEAAVDEYQAAAAILLPLADEIPDPALRRNYLSSAPVSSILAASRGGSGKKEGSK